MKIAVYSLTRDRLEFTKYCFGTLWERAGAPFDHFVLDNGSTDGTQDWLREERARFAEVVLCDRNLGIAPGCNRLLDLIAQRSDYDLAIKVDNDCEVLTPELLLRLTRLLEAGEVGEKFVLSPRVEGLIHQPSRERFERVAGTKVGITGMVGGIFLPVRWSLLKDYRYPEDLPPGVGDDVHLCGWLRERGLTIGYAEDLVVRHHLTTVGQWEAERAYFARKHRENDPDTRGRAIAPSFLPIDEIVNDRKDTLPVSVVVPLSESRRAFFEQFSLPSILSAGPERVIVVSGEGTACAKRNAGFARTKGPYVFFCDDDILLARDGLKRLHDALARAPGDVGYAYGDYVGIALPPASHPLGPVFRHEARPFDPDALRARNYVSTMSLLRREVFPGFDESLERLQDWDLWLTLLERGVNGIYVPDVLFHAYYLDRGITARADGARAEAALHRKHGVGSASQTMGISERTAEVLHEMCKSFHLRTIVELGTGAGRSLDVITTGGNPHMRIYSVDHDPRFLGAAREALVRKAPKVASVSLVHAPLERGTWGGRTQEWYSERALAGIAGPIDLLFVDGPEGSVGRFPALPVFLSRLSPRASIILDDCNREGERTILEAWRELLIAQGYEVVLDVFPTDRGLGRIQLLGRAVTPHAALPSKPETLIVDADDFCEENHGLDLLFRIKREVPSFKVNLFTIVGRCSEAFLEKVGKLDWVDLIPHGLMHETPKECEAWSYEQSIEYLDRIERLGLTRGFKAPGWQISDGMYRALLERGYWVADQRYNDHRRPKGLRAYVLDGPDGKPRPERRHYHIQNVCGNGLAERLDEILALRGDFQFLKDVPGLFEVAGEAEGLPENARTLDALIRKHGFKRGAELGVRRGELTSGLLRRNPGLSMVAVDLWADHPALNEQHDHERNYARFLENIRGLEDRATVHRMLLGDAAKLIEDQSLDFVYIDATHTYAALRQDIHTWAPKVRSGGMISGHDYHPSWDEGGIIRCVHETFRDVRVDELNSWFAWKGDMDAR